MAGVVHIPWYATVFRADRLAAALQEIAPVAVRYGATQWRIHQSRDDAYAFDHMIWFDSRDDFNRFWEGSELVAFRARVSSWYQVPLLYVWHEELAAEVVDPAAASEASGGASVTAPQGARTAA